MDATNTDYKVPIISFRRIVDDGPSAEDHDAEPAKFIVDPESVAWLKETATKVAMKGDGPSVNNYLEDLSWLKNPEWANNLQPCNEDIHRLKSAVRDVEAAKRAFRSLFQAADDREAYLRERFVTLTVQAYFGNLPDDVISTIFELAGSEDYRMACRLSVVSRHFRSIALKLPNLWRHIFASRQTLASAQLLASRSTGSILRFHAGRTRYCSMDPSFGMECNQFLSFFKFAASIPSRLSVLAFDLCMETDYSFVEKLSSSYNALTFPCLQTLRIEYEDEVLDDMHPFDIHFYRNWSLPSLTSLRAEGVIPKLQADITSNVNSCFLCIQGETVAWSLIDVMDFLGKFENVEDLEIILSGEFEDTAAPTVTFATLKRLSSRIFDVEDYVLPYFCRSFLAPNITQWSIDFGVDSNSSLNDQIRFIDKDLPNLAELDISIRRNVGKGDKGLVARVCDKYPKLQTLTVNYPNGGQGFFDCGAPGESCNRQFRQIHLKNCKGKIRGILDMMERKFWNEPDDGTGRLVIDGDEIEDHMIVERSPWHGWTRDVYPVRDD